MTDKEEFKGFQKDSVKENEEKYGREIREKYGDDCIERSNAKMMNLSPKQYDQMQSLAECILTGLENAVKNGLEPSGEEGQKLAALHKEWLAFTWPSYSKEAHTGLTQMYVDDERFKVYYDKQVEGCAQFLYEAVAFYTK